VSGAFIWELTSLTSLMIPWFACAGSRKLFAMKSRYNQEKCRQNPVKKYRDRASEPPLIGIKTHTQYVAKHHRAQVYPTKYPEIVAKPPTRFGEVPLASIKVETDFAE